MFQTRFQAGRLILLLSLLRLQHSYFGNIFLFSSRIQANAAYKSILEISPPYIYFDETKLTLYHLLDPMASLYWSPESCPGYTRVDKSDIFPAILHCIHNNIVSRSPKTSL